jgi:hypothetical protein
MAIKEGGKEGCTKGVVQRALKVQRLKGTAGPHIILVDTTFSTDVK